MSVYMYFRGSIGGLALLVALAGYANTPVAHWAATESVPERLPNRVAPELAGTLHNVDILWRVEDLIDHPSAWFGGNDSYVEVPNAPVLNPEHLTLTVWFKLPDGQVFNQKPLVLKSAPSHDGPMYQYGLFLSDDVDYPKTLVFYLSLDGTLVSHVVSGVPLQPGWNRATATYDGAALRLYCNGVRVGEGVPASGPIDAYDTPLLMGAYGNLPKTEAYCYEGYLSEVQLFDRALDAETVAASFEAEVSAYPQGGEAGGLTPYATRLNEALESNRDVWGEALIAQGGATYETMKDILHPLFYSTGHAYTEMGVHNLLFGKSGGEPPYLVPLADGSRIAANVYQSEDFLAWQVGAEREDFGSVLERLDGPYLAENYQPILETAYTDAAGNRFQQSSFGAEVFGHEGILAFIRMTVTVAPKNEGASLTLNFGDDARRRCRFDIPDRVQVVEDSEKGLTWTVAPGTHTLYVCWSPEAPLTDGIQVSAAGYEAARESMVAYWTKELAPVMRFQVPEAHVMDVQRNLLMQNLILRWRYSLGSVVYHDSFYQPESSDAVQTLGEFGHPEAYRDGLGALLDMTKGEGYYINWERGEKLTHGAHYYFLTRDAAFIEEHTDTFVEICEIFKQQMAEDEYGLLTKQRQCGDIPEVAHYIFHQTVGWQGIRDMAEVWKAVGRTDLYDQYRPLADQLKAAIDKGMTEAVTEMKDGSLFVPRALYTGELPYTSITETRIGSYWNLVIPYAFATGYWPMDGPEMGRIADYMHGHGATFLGMLRFNYYPTPIGSFRRDGLPGYYTTGVDNVYLPAYLRMIAAQDMAERQVLTFYGKLAHGMTRNTFVTGEGSTLGERPGEYYRSTYGGPTSANNCALLLNLRLMLVRDSFNHETGLPESLYLAHATPREWLEHGKEIVVDAAPTCFGPVSYRIASRLAEQRVDVSVDLPTRNAMKETKLKVRLPEPFQMVSVMKAGEEVPFDRATGIIDLSGLTGQHELKIVTRSPGLLAKDVVSD